VYIYSKSWIELGHCLGLQEDEDKRKTYREGGGRRVQDGEHGYTCGGFLSMFGKTNTIL